MTKDLLYKIEEACSGKTPYEFVQYMKNNFSEDEICTFRSYAKSNSPMLGDNLLIALANWDYFA
jgi:hypothetical protein